MVIRRTDMKRKRKEECRSPLLEDSPKRTKVHAQRKFAQGSNVNSPVITPVKELEGERSPIDVLPEPVELLPIKRPNTEDFLTFLCFRGTPILPPSLNFFNTASIVDTNGQVHEIKSESPKNGPIDTSVIAKCGSSTEKPFIAFGVRKRADPIVISKQMDRKRRHALAIQALRRKYQEQKMAKIRALTISKLSEKVTNKTLVRTNSISKTETVTKKANTIQKTKVKVVATKHVKVITQTLRPKKMCLRSFRGRFVQQELPFRGANRPQLTSKKLLRKDSEQDSNEESNNDNSEYSSEDEEPLATPTKLNRPKIIKKTLAVYPARTLDLGSRVTRSGHVIQTKVVPNLRQQIKKRILLTDPKTMVKPRLLRSTTLRKTVMSKKKSNVLKSKVQQKQIVFKKEDPPKEDQKKAITVKKDIKKELNKTTIKKEVTKSEVKKDAKQTDKKELSKSKEIKKESNKTVEVEKKVLKPSDNKKDVKTIEVKKETRSCDNKINKVDTKKEVKKVDNKKDKLVEIKKELRNKSVEVKKEIMKKEDPIKSEINIVLEKTKKELNKNSDSKQTTKTKDLEKPSRTSRSNPKESEESPEKSNPKKTTKKVVTETKVETVQKQNKKSSSESPKKQEEDSPNKETKLEPASQIVELPKLRSLQQENSARSQRPSRKTKEAAAIYMELLSHKLVHDSRVDDDDNNSIDSFPELPNAKKTEQRENELKAQAKKNEKPSKHKEEPKKLKRRSENEQSEPEETKPKLRKSDPPVDSVKKLLEKPINIAVEKMIANELERRQTRTLICKTQSEDENSDESFHANVKIPKKKKSVTRSKAKSSKVSSDDEALSKLLLDKKVKSESDSESDQSTTSDINLKALANKTKNKKFSKTKSKKLDSFSDSDEEPLSKLTLKSGEESNLTERSERKKPETRSKKVEEKIELPKPKRECAKRPQNYLPMLSSSEEEDEEYFHGFNKSETVKVATPTSVANLNICVHGPPSDLLSKDISRRFGKGKVNMSNEQIEKWIKESAMAGSSVKSENDAMLKFGERIPTETSLESSTAIDTKKLKACLLQVMKSELKSDSKEKRQLKLDIASSSKPQPIDRKLIFRKDKKNATPNLNAFSPENESSVYAFGEENDVVSTPFRRPCRRPSSTATSRSEDEQKQTDSESGKFRKPPIKLKEDETKNKKSDQSKPPKPSSSSNKLSDLSSEDFKYKVPSSPSASSSSSAKLYKKQAAVKARFEIGVPVPVQEFPTKVPAQLVEGPVFHPTDQEFQDPLEYIERIRSKAEQFGICKIVPPASFKPECKVTDDMRFTAYNQYVHKMLHRWGPNFKELMAIKRYLDTQNISLTHPPWIGGMEIDLPRLYQTVQSLGGLKEVIEKKKWPKVSELMKIPKSAQDRVTKLDDIYCKYLLPYDTLSIGEREKLFDEVETEWAKRESKGLIKAQQKPNCEIAEDEEESESEDDIDECIVKGRNMALNGFYRIARNTMTMHFKAAEPPAVEVEEEFWKHVTQRNNHICVHSGSIDSGNWGYGFAVSKNSPFARHAWNLKVLTNNSGSVLRSLGPVMGVTVPTLHVGMVFSACCWYRDPHGLPWIEYLHTGGNKIWYAIPNSNSEQFHATLKKLVPNHCRNKNFWLASDTAMVPPSLLIENNVSLCRVVQEPGQFIVVFPKAFTSNISTGYVVSESVYFAPPTWLKTARTLFEDLKNSCEPSMFSLERLLFCIATDLRTSVEVLRQITPIVKEFCDKEKMLREKIVAFGDLELEKMPLPESVNTKKKKIQGDDGDYECEICRMNLYVSMVFDTEGDATYCLEHAVEKFEKKLIESSKSKLMFTYDVEDLDGLLVKIQRAIEAKLTKKLPNKYAGMPTLLNKQF